MIHIDRRSLFKYCAVLALLAAPLFAACDSNSPDETGEGVRTFRFETSSGAMFVARTDDDDILHMADSLLALPLDQRNMHINGPIASGDGGYNEDWSWHFVPSAWTLADFSVEVCDGAPSYVEENVTYFVETVGRYCPWSSRILEEVE